jgi:hypothetical protein
MSSKGYGKMNNIFINAGGTINITTPSNFGRNGGA